VIVIYNKGDWVFNKNDGTRGFVDTSAYHASVITFIRNGHLITSNVSNHSLMRLGDDLRSEELFELINLALIMGDRNWFYQLSEELKQQTERKMAE
jgi:uncharacterized protein YpiB (UPF0302 family)